MRKLDLVLIRATFVDGKKKGVLGSQFIHGGLALQ